MATPIGGSVSSPLDTRGTGQVLTYQRKDGLTSWYLRVRAHGSRYRITLGTELDGWTEARARIELQNVLAKIQAGLWEPPARQSTVPDDPSFHEFASSWLARRRPSYKQRTYEHYRYLLTHHLLPAFASLRLSQLEYAVIDRYVEVKQLESEEVRAATLRGVALRDGNGRRKRPLANSTINATLKLLIGILDEAVRRKLLLVNPAREKGLRLKEQRPRGNVLEVDELEDLLAGAAEIDQMRRTYISMMFAAGAELPYVMAQVGHADSKVTLEIYAQVLKRRDREQIGRAFDHLLIGGAHNEQPTEARASKRSIGRSKTGKRRDRNTD
jgi:hypothetical protein